MKLTFMNMFKFEIRTGMICTLLISTVLIGTMTGCQSKPPKPAPVVTVTPAAPEDPISLLQKANQARSPEREQFMLQATDLYLQRKDLTRANRLLNLLRQQNLSGVQLATQQKLSLQLKQQLQIDEAKNNKSTDANSDNTVKIAVLLAQSGRLKSAADAIRQGILLAYYHQAQRGMTAELMFFDTADSQVSTVYQQAIAAGAKVIIGPLDKDQVKQLAAMPNLTIPVLALNYLPEGTPVASPLLFQFGLATEDEARTISLRGRQLGYRRAALLYPQNEWGERTAAAFRQDWQQQDGILTSERGYGTQAGADYTDPVRSLLGVYKTVGDDGKPKQMRREDIDFIVMISDARTARQLKPMLNYYFADNLPTFSTFNIFTDAANSGRDQDINGVQFTELPWVLAAGDELKRDYLRQPSAAAIPAGAETLRLVALGIDSFRIAPRLSWLQENVDHRIEGATGILHLNATKRVQRQSAWAKFVDGRPTPLNTEDTRTLQNENSIQPQDINIDENADVDASNSFKRQHPAKGFTPLMLAEATPDFASNDYETDNSAIDINADESSMANELTVPESPAEDLFPSDTIDRSPNELSPSEPISEESLDSPIDMGADNDTMDSDTAFDNNPSP